MVVGWLLEIYILTASKVVSEKTPICDSAHSWWLYSAAPLRNQAASIMSRYPTQLHDPDSELTDALMPYAKLGTDKYQRFDSSKLHRFGHCPEFI